MKLLSLECVIVLVIAISLYTNAEDDGDYDSAEDTDHPVSAECLQCICHAMTGCNQKMKKCKGPVCGAYKLSWGYWADSGKPTLAGESSEAASAFSNCALNLTCASESVQGYMSNFEQDCNEDGKIDCMDFAAIHKLGGYGCGGALPADFKDKMEKCLGETKEKA